MITANDIKINVTVNNNKTAKSLCTFISKVKNYKHKLKEENISLYTLNKLLFNITL